MTTIGTSKSGVRKKALICGAGELGKEVVIELQRLGVEVVAVDRYDNAPAMQVAHRSYTISMLDGAKLREVIEKEQPDYIIPEVESIATKTLLELEKEGFNVVPTARATYLTMNREGIRRLAAEELGVPTSRYKFAETKEEFHKALESEIQDIYEKAFYRMFKGLMALYRRDMIQTIFQSLSASRASTRAQAIELLQLTLNDFPYAKRILILCDDFNRDEKVTRLDDIEHIPLDDAIAIVEAESDRAISKTIQKVSNLLNQDHDEQT